MEKYYTMYKTHSIHIETNGITIDDFYYELNSENSDLTLSQIEKIYAFPDGYLKDLINKYF